MLCSAWNTFIRLLDLKFTENFQCQICGNSPDTIICDGTLLGFRKDLLPTLLRKSDVKSLLLTNGSKYSDHIIVHSAHGRELLLKYSGYTKDRKRLIVPIALEISEFKTLLNLLEKDSIALAKLIKSIQNESSSLTAPSEYIEIACNFPACGIFQYLGNEEVIEILKNID